ncbi:MAG: AMP-binding protein [Acidimicrobiales bacterium]|jgi:acyl-CoA synthetase (AMP-forming)/AMP-acid ligase II|nr:AMP-binding protein [Acidimicrobiales bacterium]
MDDTADRAPAHPDSFWQLVERRAASTPEHVVLADDLGRELTAEGLRDTALAVAAALHGDGIGDGSSVSWQLPTCLEALVLSVALTRLGVVQNPIIAMLREREVSSVLDQVHPDLVVVPGVWRDFDHEAMVRHLAPQAAVRIVDHRSAASTGGLALATGDPATLPPAVPPTTDETRWVFSTSGSTGGPKGVRHSDASVMAGCNGMVPRLRMDRHDVYPIAFPIAHIGGPVMLAMALHSGCRLVLLDAFDPATSPEVMAEAGATLLGSALPFHLAYMAAQERHGPEPLYPHLKACTSGGAAKPAGHHERVKAALGGAGTVSAWGLTEFPLATQASLDDTDEQLGRTEGRPAPGTEIRVVAADGSVCAPGEEGELRLKGAPMFLGYADASLDAAAFDDEGWFRSGDLGVQWPTGHVEITGRLKDLIVRNAENISAKAVEDVVRTHPGVVDAAVVGLPHPRTGEQVCAVLVMAPGADLPTVAALGAHCTGAGLARYACPERVEVRASIPRNAMGKVLTQDLRRSLLAI